MEVSENTSISHDYIIFFDESVDKIKNFKLQMDGRKNGIRFTAKEIRLIMTLYNGSLAGYREIKKAQFKSGLMKES